MSEKLRSWRMPVQVCFHIRGRNEDKVKDKKYKHKGPDLQYKYGLLFLIITN